MSPFATHTRAGRSSRINRANTSFDKRRPREVSRTRSPSRSSKPSPISSSNTAPNSSTADCPNRNAISVNETPQFIRRPRKNDSSSAVRGIGERPRCQQLLHARRHGLHVVRRRRIDFQRIRSRESYCLDPLLRQRLARRQHRVRIHAEPKIRLTSPVLQIMPRVAQTDAVRHISGEIRNLILVKAAFLEPFASRKVQICGQVVVRNEMSMIATATSQQLAAQARIFVHLQHVNADMRYASCQRFGERELPAFWRLIRQSGNQVNSNVPNAARAQANNVIQRDGPCYGAGQPMSIPDRQMTARRG